jgi:energy-coupling factor transport system ATP-binding protein
MNIVIENMTYTYLRKTVFEKRAIDNLSITIPDGQFLGIIGPTGSGKSTFIQHLNGLLIPDSGKITVDGINVEKKNFKALRNRVGIVFQYPENQLFEETVYKDIAFGPIQQGLKEEEVSERVLYAISCVGIKKDLLDKSVFELSGGQKRRIAIAGILAMNPKILILDEPAAGLDPQGKNEILGYIEKLHKENNLTIILVSHSMEDIAKYVDRIVVLNEGKIYADASPVEIFADDIGLKRIGLLPPQVTSLMKELKKIEPALNDRIITVEEAVKELYKILK